MILLVVDAQKLITNENLYNFNEFVTNVEKLIGACRQNNVEVIYIRHDDGPSEELTKGKKGYEIYEKFEPLDNEKIFDKNVNSAFKSTGLLEYLKSKNQMDIIIVGLQTDYCMDATIKCGFEHGFNIIVPEYTNTTVDNNFMKKEQSYKYYNEFIWNKRYARCIPLDETINLINNLN